MLVDLDKLKQKVEEHINKSIIDNGGDLSPEFREKLIDHALSSLHIATVVLSFYDEELEKAINLKIEAAKHS